MACSLTAVHNSSSPASVILFETGLIRRSIKSGFGLGLVYVVSISIIMQVVVSLALTVLLHC